jgi:alpha-beta hydrolase superfamily lysophospholipase
MTANEPNAFRPDTIVLIHGLWLTPRSWEHWIERYAAAGFETVAPAWPGMEVEVEELRRDPSVMNSLGVIEVADHYEQLIRKLDSPPIIMGHSFGGAITQILLDRGLGCAGVAIHPAPIKGVKRLPISSLRSAMPVLKNPANRKRTVPLTPEQWHYSFTNTVPVDDAAALYERYHVPAPGRPLFQAATANFNRHAATKVNAHNNNRAALLLVAGGADHVVPKSIVQETRKRYHKSTARTDYKEFAGRPHFTGAVPGWEEVADFCLSWGTQNAEPRIG